MRIIDLLNKIANGEEVPKIIKREWKYKWQYDEIKEKYTYMQETGERFDEDWLVIELLNDEIEIIEEEKKKPEKINIYNYDEPDIMRKVNEIIDYLNLKTNKSFRYTQNNINKIKTRLKEGFTLDDFKKVIDIKSLEWLKDSKMNTYLRPETLFGNKFESYLQQGQKEPKWLDKTFEEQKASTEEQQEMEDLLREFRGE